MIDNRGRGQRAGITRQDVLSATRVVYAREGLVGVSMRAVSGQLNVHPNALYSYVNKKEDLITDLLDDTLESATVTPLYDDDPLESIYGIFKATYDSLCKHTDLLPAFLAYRGVNGKNAKELEIRSLDLFGQAGFDTDFSKNVLQTLIAYTVGTAAFDATGEESDHITTVNQGLKWILQGAKQQTDYHSK